MSDEKNPTGKTGGIAPDGQMSPEAAAAAAAKAAAFASGDKGAAKSADDAGTGAKK